MDSDARASQASPPTVPSSSTPEPRRFQNAAYTKRRKTATHRKGDAKFTSKHVEKFTQMIQEHAANPLVKNPIIILGDSTVLRLAQLCMQHAPSGPAGLSMFQPYDASFNSNVEGPRYQLIKAWHPNGRSRHSGDAFHEYTNIYAVSLATSYLYALGLQDDSEWGTKLTELVAVSLCTADQLL